MARLKDTKITEVDLNEFLTKEHNDFLLEIACLRELSAGGFRVSHGGTYEDRVTKKSRQYDIRASCVHELVQGAVLKVRLAVECKFLSENFPLLVSHLPRAQHESFHDIVFSYAQKRDQTILEANATTLRIQPSVYRFKEPVGKSTTQVGRHIQTNELVSGDAEVFEKWSQAIASAHDLVADSMNDYTHEGQSHCFTFILPVLVVTDDTLWVANYSPEGELLRQPQLTKECDIYIGQDIWTGPNGISYSLSHLKVFTKSGFAGFLNRLNLNDKFRELLFPQETMLRHMLQTAAD